MGHEGLSLHTEFPICSIMGKSLTEWMCATNVITRVASIQSIFLLAQEKKTLLTERQKEETLLTLAKKM